MTAQLRTFIDATPRAGGFVYVLSNPDIPGILKVGKSTDPIRRIDELRSPGVPSRHVVEFAVYCSDHHSAEVQAHRALAAHRVGDAYKGTTKQPETFRCDLATAVAGVLSCPECSDPRRYDRADVAALVLAAQVQESERQFKEDLATWERHAGGRRYHRLPEVPATPEALERYAEEQARLKQPHSGRVARAAKEAQDRAAAMQWEREQAMARVSAALEAERGATERENARVLAELLAEQERRKAASPRSGLSATVKVLLRRCLFLPQ
jgi:hypothetical protein